MHKRYDHYLGGNQNPHQFKLYHFEHMHIFFIPLLWGISLLPYHQESNFCMIHQLYLLINVKIFSFIEE